MRQRYEPAMEPEDVREDERLDKNNAECPAVDRVGGFICTRPPGHAGDHIAHGCSGCIYVRWDDAEEEAKAA